MRLLICLILAAALIGGCARYDGPASANFDGREFRNLDPIELDVWAMARWDYGHPRVAPASLQPPEDQQPLPERVDGDVRYSVINHATVLIQMGGMNILTDPIWSARAGPAPLIGAPRVVEPAIAIDDLPPIDLILVSHDHYDHMDAPTLRRLAARDQPIAVAGLGNAGRLRGWGFESAIEMDWWQSVHVGGLEVTFVPAQHYSQRGLFDVNATLWGGFVIRGAGRTIYFAGDTGYGDFFGEIASRLGRPDLAFLPIGAYWPADLLGDVHLDPTEAVQAHIDLGARQSVAMHYGTFLLSAEPIAHPPEALAEARTRAGLADDEFTMPLFGQFGSLPAPAILPQTQHWQPVAESGHQR